MIIPVFLYSVCLGAGGGGGGSVYRSYVKYVCMIVDFTQRKLCRYYSTSGS